MNRKRLKQEKRKTAEKTIFAVSYINISGTFKSGNFHVHRIILSRRGHHTVPEARAWDACRR